MNLKFGKYLDKYFILSVPQFSLILNKYKLQNLVIQKNARTYDHDCIKTTLLGGTCYFNHYVSKCPLPPNNINLESVFFYLFINQPVVLIFISYSITVESRMSSLTPHEDVIVN